MVKTSNKSDPYTRYYLNQVGSGVGTVYRGVSYQKGHGIGSFLGGLFRTVLPILKSGARAVGKEAVRTGMNVLGDIASDSTQPLKKVIRKRVIEAGGNLAEKAGRKIRTMTGAGYPPGTRERKPHLKVVLRSRKTRAPKKTLAPKKRSVVKKRKRKIKSKINVKDIFS